MQGWRSSDGKAVKERPAMAGDRLSSQELLRAYRTMVLSRKLDDKEIQLKNQSLIFFQISGAGHEAVLTAAGMVLRPASDWFYPYYRDRALCLRARHDAARDAARRGRRQGRSGVGRTADALALGPQAPQHRLAVESDRNAVPAGHRLPRKPAGMFEKITDIADREDHFHADEVVYMSVGEGATSEGEFWESLNSACTLKLPVVILVEDNGYAISVPVEVQTPGGDISKIVASFPGLLVQSIDGTDFIASYAAMRDGGRVRPRAQRARARARQGDPALLALALGRRKAVQDGGGTRRRSDARSDRAARRLPDVGRHRHARGAPAILREVESEVNAAADQAIGAEKPSRDTAQLFVYSPDVDPSSGAFDRRRARRAARHDGRRDQPHPQGRTGAQSADCGVRRRRGGLLRARKRSRRFPARGASSR